jgi:hypothetical protein
MRDTAVVSPPAPVSLTQSAAQTADLMTALAAAEGVCATASQKTAAT